jgi:hypothetical protein
MDAEKIVRASLLLGGSRQKVEDKMKATHMEGGEILFLPLPDRDDRGLVCRKDPRANYRLLATE